MANLSSMPLNPKLILLAPPTENGKPDFNPKFEIKIRNRPKSSCKAPQELKIYISNDLCAINMVSVLSRSETAYLVISKNRPISKFMEKMWQKQVKFKQLPKSRCMPPQELKFYILHGLYVLNTFSVVSRSKTSYLVISKNPPISKIKKKNHKEK